MIYIVAIYSICPSFRAHGAASGDQYYIMSAARPGTRIAEYIWLYKSARAYGHGRASARSGSDLADLARAALVLSKLTGHMRVRTSHANSSPPRRNYLIHKHARVCMGSMGSRLVCAAPSDPGDRGARLIQHILGTFIVYSGYR